MFDLRERDVDPRQELTESFPDLAPRIGKLLERFRDAMILAALTRAC